MLRLMLLRHAKALAESAGGDHARALAGRGRHQAQEMGRYMQAEGLLPDAMLASDSVRTSQTWQEMQACFSPVPWLRFDRALYLAHPRSLLAAVHAAPAIAKTVLVIGHNPGLAELADALTGYGDRYAAARMRQKYPTCGLAVLDFDMDNWAQAALKTARLERFIVPADIGADVDD